MPVFVLHMYIVALMGREWGDNSDARARFAGMFSVPRDDAGEAADGAGKWRLYEES